MIRVLFVCHGNICRSPLAEFTLKALVSRLKLEQEFSIASAATSQEELGNPVYPPVRQILKQMHLDFEHKRARQISAADAKQYDYIIAMERYNLENLQRLRLPLKPEQVHLLLDFTDQKGDIADPWYTRDFEEAYTQILAGCVGLLERLRAQGLLLFSPQKLADAAANLRA